MINKFRVWDKEDIKFLKSEDKDGLYFRGADGEVFSIADIISGNYNHGRYVVQQSTGVIGKKKREIFEGDICRLEYNEYYGDVQGSVEYWQEEAKFIINAKFEHGGAALCSVGNYLDKYKGNKNEVIGNIFENPELIIKNKKIRE